MRKTSYLLASAPIAVAAMAALHTPAVSAQEAPVIVLDVPTTAPAQTPPPVATMPAPHVSTAPSQPIVLPDPVAVEPVEPVEPVAAPVVQRAEPAPVAREVRPRPVAADTRSMNAASRVEASGPAAGQLTETAPVTNAAADPMTGPAIDSIAVDAGQADVAPIPEPVNDGSTAALLYALLAVGGLGVASFLLFRSRRRSVAEPELIERPIVPASPVMAREPETAAAYEAPRYEAAQALPADGAAVPLPAELPRTEAERGRLLQRMIAARPDRANPFSSHKARAKRARLILQSIGTRFNDRKPGIDLSQYTNIWPELRGWRPATA